MDIKQATRMPWHHHLIHDSFSLSWRCHLMLLLSREEFLWWLPILIFILFWPSVCRWLKRCEREEKEDNIARQESSIKKIEVELRFGCSKKNGKNLKINVLKFFKINRIFLPRYFKKIVKLQPSENFSYQFLPTYLISIISCGSINSPKALFVTQCHRK